MSSRIGLKYVSLFDLSASTGYMHLGLPDLQVRKLGGHLFENGVVDFTWLTCGEAIGHDSRWGVGELLIVRVTDV